MHANQQRIPCIELDAETLEAIEKEQPLCAEEIIRHYSHTERNY